MGLQCGIVGLPNVGKSTLFNCLSNAKAQSANYPFCTIESNLGTVQVPDSRLYKLGTLVKPQKVVPTAVEIVDIAGLVRGASKGEGLGNRFLGNIRECNAIIHVLRCFENKNIVHIDEIIDPVRDKEIIDIELQLKDLETVEKRLEKAKKTAKSGKKEDQKSVHVLEKIKNILEKGQNVRRTEFTDNESVIVSELQLLTSKPVLYVCNVDEISALSGNNFSKAVEEMVKTENNLVLTLAAQTEADIAELENYEERRLFLDELGLEEPGINRLIKAAYNLLNLETFFTTGIKEVRAWTFRKGSTAFQCAGLIHSDFQRGFIRAEVIKVSDYIHYNSEQTCREAGKIAIEGKEYLVKDGDVIRFRFNV